MKGNIFACLNICQNFVLMDISWEYVMAAQLQQLCRTSTAASSIFFNGHTQAPINDKFIRKVDFDG